MHQYKPCKCNHKTFLSLNKKCRRLDSAWAWTKNDLKLVDSLPKESPQSTPNGNTHCDTVTENVSVRQSADSPADKNDASSSSNDQDILCNITSQKSAVIQNTINTNAVHKYFHVNCLNCQNGNMYPNKLKYTLIVEAHKLMLKKCLTKILRHL